MGTGWAVGSAATLALFAMTGLSMPGIGASMAPTVLYALVAFAALASWAYAIAMAAYGSKGALAALLACALIAGGLGLVATARCGVGACAADTPHDVAGVLGWPLAAVSLLTVWGVATELRRRRGGVQWLTAVGVVLPLLAHAAWILRLYVA